MRGRRQVGIAHAEIDDIGAGITGRSFRAIDLFENVRRQPADAVKIFHGCPDVSFFDNRYLRLLSRLGPGASRAAVGGAIPWTRAARRPGAAGGYGFRAQMVSLGDEAVHRLLDLI